MPSLRSALERYLDGWQERLPEAWREALDGVEPNFNAIPRDVSLDQGVRILPDRRRSRRIRPRRPRQDRVFYALEGVNPSEANVVVIGNDPYPDPHRATGRSFEQGDLIDWNDDLDEAGRVTPSLLSLLCAAAALRPGARRLELDRGDLRGRRERLLRGLRNGSAMLPPPRSMFENLTGQGVLWLNRTLTISAFDTDTRRGGTTWRALEEHRKQHRALWRPITCAIVSTLMEEAQERPIVFALFGREARNLQRWRETGGTRRGASSENLCFVESGHPSAPRYFFQSGNPLGRINDELTARHCDPIDWTGPPAGQTTNNLARLSTASQCSLGRPGTSTIRAVDRIPADSASARSPAIIARTVGKYRTTLKRLADQ